MSPITRLRVLLPVISLLVTSFLAAACSDDNVDLIDSSGDKFISPNEIMTWDADTSQGVSITAQNFAVDSGVATGFATRVGKEVSGGKTVIATTYLKFSASFPSLDTATAVSASLVLSPAGETSKTGTVGLDIVEIAELWEASEVYSRKPLTVKTSKLAQTSMQVQDSAAIEIALPKSFADALLLEVKKGTAFLADSSKGIALVTTSGSVLTTLNTSNTKLRLVVDRKTSSGTTERLSKLMSVSEYAFAVNPAITAFGTDAIYMQSVTGSRSQLKFDLSQLQSRSQIVSAELVLQRDPAFSTLADTTNLVTVHYGGDGPAISSTYSSVTAVADNAKEKFTANVTKMVQSWAGKPSRNYGFILTASKESGTLQTWKFYGPSAPVGQRPRLVITYVISR